MWVLLRPPRFGGATHANGHDNWSDIAKSVFQVHGIDAAGNVNRSSSAQASIRFEACTSSHHWSRELQALGHALEVARRIFGCSRSGALRLAVATITQLTRSVDGLLVRHAQNGLASRRQLSRMRLVVRGAKPMQAHTDQDCPRRCSRAQRCKQAR
jgi:hypothetical protein